MRASIIGWFAIVLVSFPSAAAADWQFRVEIRDPTGRGVANARVSLHFVGPNRALTQSTTSQNGEATIRLDLAHAPRDLTPMRLLLVAEAPNALPAVLSLRGAPRSVYRLTVESGSRWTQAVRAALAGLVDVAATLLLPAGTSVPVAPLITGDPCSAMPAGIQCRTSSAVNRPTLVVFGRVVFGDPSALNGQPTY